MAEIRNPNQQGSGGSGSDPRSMMLFAVMFLVIFLGLQYWKSKKSAGYAGEQRCGGRAVFGCVDGWKQQSCHNDSCIDIGRGNCCERCDGYGADADGG